MELRHLRYFVAIAETESFRRAATKLGVSQSPLSRQIRDLEEELGFALFEPSGRGVKLTAAGRHFAEKAVQILSQLDGAIADARETSAGRVGTMVIGFETGTTFLGSLASIVAEYRKRAPRIRLELLPMSSAEQWQALTEGRIALGYGYYVSDDAALSHVEIARDRLGLVVPNAHPLASKSRITLADLAGEPVFLQPRTLYPRLHDDLVAAVRAHGIVLNLAAEIADLEALLTLVSCGDGLTFIGEKAKIMLFGAAVWKPIADFDVEVRDVVMWRSADTLSPLVHPLVEIARELAARAGGLRAPQPPWGTGNV
jgi:LysR family transcriptional regulator, benzoate and cis,cis-muconate-responsive activator of ben and cat genes